MARNSEPRSDYIIVPHRPGQRLRRFLVLLLFSVGAAVLGFYVGLKQSQYRFEAAVSARQALKHQVKVLRSDNASLSQRLVDLEKGHTIDRQAIARARDTITRQDARINQLKGDVAFYKNIMAPSSKDTGLQVQRLRLRTVPGVRRFSYRLVLTQVGNNHRYIHGVVAVNLVGVRKGKREVLSLRDVDASVKRLGIEFKFRYFQDIRGQLVLPAGFSPDEVQVVAKPRGSRSNQVERTFRWQNITETQINVGQTQD